MGEHYRQHMREWNKRREAEKRPYDWSDAPIDHCWRCKVSYLFQRLRWLLNGDIIA